MTKDNKSDDSQQQTDQPSRNGLFQMVVNYIVWHWLGELSLGVSFWANAILLSVVYNVAWVFLYPDIVDCYLLFSQEGYVKSEYLKFFASYLASSLILEIWSIVGLWRSASGHIARTGRFLWARIAKYFYCVLTVLLWLDLIVGIILISA